MWLILDIVACPSLHDMRVHLFAKQIHRAAVKNDRIQSKKTIIKIEHSPSKQKVNYGDFKQEFKMLKQISELRNNELRLTTM